MTSTNEIELAAEEYEAEAFRMAPYKEFTLTGAFLSGAAHASKDMVPVEVVEKLIKALELAWHNDNRNPNIYIVMDGARIALAEYQTWKDKNA